MTTVKSWLRRSVGLAPLYRLAPVILFLLIGPAPSKRTACGIFPVAPSRPSPSNLVCWQQLNMPNNKSRMACEASIKRLVSGARSCYLWTLTVPEAGLPASVVSRRWHAVSVAIVRKWHCSGVRVFEVHPGGHGWHIHFVLNGSTRLPVRALREITTRLGFGRINVKRIPADKACYVAKYLGKQFERGEIGRGVRLWSPFGSRFASCIYTRVRDVQSFVDGAPSGQLYQDICASLFGRCQVWSYREHALTRSLSALVTAGILCLSSSGLFYASDSWPEFCNLDGLEQYWKDSDSARRFVGFVNLWSSHVA